MSIAFIPSYPEFEARFRNAENQIIYSRLSADLDTPVSLMLKLTATQPYSFLLESVTGGEHRGRYSIIGMKPDLIWRCRGATSEICREALYDPQNFSAETGHPLENLRALIAESTIELPDVLPDSSAGLFGYFGYDMIRLTEHLPNINPDPLALDDAVLMRPSLIAIHDVVKNDVILVAPVWANSGLSAKAAYAQAAERISNALRDLDRPVAALSLNDAAMQDDTPAQSNFDKDAYLEAIAHAKAYITKGDIFQVVPSQRWAKPFDLPPFFLYRALRRTNPSPFMFYFNFDGLDVIGASPEILVSVDNDTITIRPIAGTRPRGKTPEHDQALEQELLADPKELAEHLMLLDLGRNDVGRVAEIGSVHPTERFTIERYSHVMHIVSNVEGKLSKDHDALSALLAGMPAGTLSGAPKIRAMEIIDELEPHKRGIYGGGVGYFSAGGNLKMCIALRTALIKDKTLYAQAGGGVVYDSDPEMEFQETEHKAGAIWQAATEAYRFGNKGNL